MPTIETEAPPIIGELPRAEDDGITGAPRDRQELRQAERLRTVAVNVYEGRDGIGTLKDIPEVAARVIPH